MRDVDGFYIGVPGGRELGPEEVRGLQLSIMDSIHDFCESHGITYFLTGGSLLGAVRHAGCIPWDDDVDVAMPRHNYERFLREYVALGGLPYEVESMHACQEYYLPFAKVVDRRTLLVEDVDSRHVTGVYVDVFPLDNLSDDYRAALRLFRWVGLARAELLVKNLRFGKRLWAKDLLLACGKTALSWRSRERILQTIDKRCQRYASDALTRYVGIIVLGTYGNGEIHESCLYGQRVLAEFEGREYYIPAGYDGILRQLYGDYMTPPPLNERVSHHRCRAWYVGE